MTVTGGVRGLDGAVYLLGERWVYEEEYLPFVGKWWASGPKFGDERDEAWDGMKLVQNDYCDMMEFLYNGKWGC